MSRFTSIMDLFKSLGLRKSSDDDEEARINRAPTRRNPTFSLSFSRLARISPIRHPEPSKADTKRSKDSTTNKASATGDHGEIGSQVSHTPTDSVTGHSGPSPSSERPRIPSTISTVSHASIRTTVHTTSPSAQSPHATSTISTISHESIQTIVPPTSPIHSQENAIASTSASTAPSHDTSRADAGSSPRSSEGSTDSLDPYNAEMARKRALFETPSPATRSQRRQALYEMPDDLYMTAGRWFFEHPEDLWATDEDQQANFTRMALDRRIEMAAQDDVVGLKNNDEVEFLRGNPGYRRMRKRAKKFGWFRAWQENLFGKKWCVEGGMFGKKGRSGPLPEDVGPMGETL